MKKSIFIISIISILILVGYAFAAGKVVGAPIYEAQKINLSEIIASIMSALIFYIVTWAKPHIEEYKNKLNEIADAKIKAIDNERIGGRLKDAKDALNKNAEAKLTEFYFKLDEARRKSGIVTIAELKGIAVETAESFAKAESDSTTDLMKGLKMDLIECAEIEVKAVWGKIVDRFRPKA